MVTHMKYGLSDGQTWFATMRSLYSELCERALAVVGNSSCKVGQTHNAEVRFTVALCRKLTTCTSCKERTMRKLIIEDNCLLGRCVVW
jgi:hypothetical protein